MLLVAPWPPQRPRAPYHYALGISDTGEGPGRHAARPEASAPPDGAVVAISIPGDVTSDDLRSLAGMYGELRGVT